MRPGFKPTLRARFGVDPVADIQTGLSIIRLPWMRILGGAIVGGGLGAVLAPAYALVGVLGGGTLGYLSNTIVPPGSLVGTKPVDKSAYEQGAGLGAVKGGIQEKR